MPTDSQKIKRHYRLSEEKDLLSKTNIHLQKNCYNYTLCNIRFGQIYA